MSLSGDMLTSSAISMDALTAHFQRRDALIAEFSDARRSGSSVGLNKSTSNLFRHRDERGKHKIDARRFHHVLQVDPDQMSADVEGMLTYAEFVDATLPHGLLPAVVPQLKTITVGGAISGVGIESSSFQYGLVHETIQEMEILLADGRIVVCSPDQNQDLFYGFPNSYGTLGYVLRLKAKLIPAQPYVCLSHSRFSDPDSYFAAIDTSVRDSSIDYLDGTIFGSAEMYLTTGRFCNQVPRASNYQYMRIYYQSIRRKREDWLTAKDYIWRWDTDWFWCSKQFNAQNPVVRLLATKWLLNSRTYQRIMRLAHTAGYRGANAESVIQDVDVPVQRAPEFFWFLIRQIGITPIWVCPIRNRNPYGTFDLYALDPQITYVNFGFWDTVPSTYEDGHFNRLVEAKMVEIGGKKGLYSSSYLDREVFWQLYNHESYCRLKHTYDPDGVFPDLYEKCVGRR